MYKMKRKYMVVPMEPDVYQVQVQEFKHPTIIGMMIMTVWIPQDFRPWYVTDKSGKNYLTFSTKERAEAWIENREIEREAEFQKNLFIEKWQLEHPAYEYEVKSV